VNDHVNNLNNFDRDMVQTMALDIEEVMNEELRRRGSQEEAGGMRLSDSTCYRHSKVM
jgi:hypothetical protein